MKFLVIEDTVSLNDIITEELKRYNGGSDVVSAFNGEAGLYKALNYNFDLIVLDLMLPKMQGSDVLKQLRKRSACPVLVLTAIDDTETKVKLLEIGADDYMVKPFESSELSARITAILRRYNENFGNNIYRCESMEINYFKKSVKISGEFAEELCGKLYDLLEYFTHNKGVKLSRESLFNRIWGFDSDTVGSVVEVYISKLRKILQDKGGEILSKHLVTVKNVGYLWTETGNA